MWGEFLPFLLIGLLQQLGPMATQGPCSHRDLAYLCGFYCSHLLSLPSLPAVMSRPSDCCHFFQFFQISFGFSFLAIISYMLSSSFFDSFTPYHSNPLHCRNPQVRPFLLLVCFYMSSRHCWRQNFTISATGVSAIEDHLVFKVKWASIFLWLWRFQAREKMMLHFSTYRNNNACWSSMTESDGKLS